jgi:uncharacterized membrane protein (UPF0127 family)
MIIKNRTQNVAVSSNAVFTQSLWDKGFGLLLKKFHNRTLVLKTRFGIHTFLMKQPIDVLVLSNNLEIKKIKEHLTPNNVFFWNPAYSIVVELPKGTIKKNHCKLGDQLIFVS